MGLAIQNGIVVFGLAGISVLLRLVVMTSNDFGLAVMTSKDFGAGGRKASSSSKIDKSTKDGPVFL